MKTKPISRARIAVYPYSIQGRGNFVKSMYYNVAWHQAITSYVIWDDDRMLTFKREELRKAWEEGEIETE